MTLFQRHPVAAGPPIILIICQGNRNFRNGPISKNHTSVMKTLSIKSKKPIVGNKKPLKRLNFGLLERSCEL